MFKGQTGKDQGGKPREHAPDAHDGPSHGVTIRPAKLLDGTYIAYLSDQVFGIFGSYGPVISQWFASSRCRTLMAIAEKGPVGFVMIGPRYKDWGSSVTSEVLAIAVDPEHQTKGIGSMLLEAMEEKAEEMHVEQLVLHTASKNKAALHLFETHGFRLKRSISRFYPRGQDALEMVKVIPRKGGIPRRGIR